MRNIVYLNGQFLPYKKATIPLATHAFHYGTGCFEGIRGYWSKKEGRLFVFRLKDHYRRLERSAKTLYMKLPFPVDKLCEITIELLRKNDYKEGVYIRPILYKSAENILKFDLTHLSDGFAVYTAPLGHYLDVSKGIPVVTSSWKRMDSRAIPAFAKPTGLYINTSLANTEAKEKGAGEAIFQNFDGTICEGSAENIFLVKDGRITTPAVNQNILVGITRDTIITLAKKELGKTVNERRVTPKELSAADEVFLSGTGAEVTPVTGIDNKPIGSGRPGPISSILQKLYFKIVTGNNHKYSHWITKIQSGNINL